MITKLCLWPLLHCLFSDWFFLDGKRLINTGWRRHTTTRNQPMFFEIWQTFPCLTSKSGQISINVYNVEAEVSVCLFCSLHLIITHRLISNSNREDISYNTREIEKLCGDLVKLQDHNWHSNLRFVCLPEGEENDDPIGFLLQKLLLWFPALSSRVTLEIKHAHQVYSEM